MKKISIVLNVILLLVVTLLIGHIRDNKTAAIPQSIDEDVYGTVDYPLLEIPIRYNDSEIVLIVANNVMQSDKTEYFYTNNKQILENMQMEFNVISFPIDRGTTPDSFVYVYQDGILLKEIPFFGEFTDDQFNLEVKTKNEIEHMLKQEMQPTESHTNEINSSAKAPTYQSNDGYKLFYGTWEYVEVISQHFRLGGDENYSSLIGNRLTYHPDFFENNSGRINSPTYLISIYPLKQDEYNSFFTEQIGLEEILPNNEYFTHVHVVNKPAGLDMDLYGFNMILKNDNTMYAFDYNCLYKLERVSYIDDYDSNSKPMYNERF